MKKLLFIFTLMLGIAFTSCGNTTKSKVDSITVNFTDSIDSISIDSISTDNVK